MLDKNNVTLNFDSALVQLSPLTVRKLRDRDENGVFIEVPELQFQLTNISGAMLAGIEAEVNYYSAGKEFAGTDSDLRLEPLKPGDVHTFSMFVDPPGHSGTAELKIGARKQSLLDRVPSGIQVALLVAMTGYIVYSDFVR